MQVHNSTLPSPNCTPWNKEADRSKASALGKARLVNSDQAAHRKAHPRLGDGSTLPSIASYEAAMLSP